MPPLDSLINPPRKTRISSLLAYYAILVIGIPFWWVTTSIERRPLEGEVALVNAWQGNEYDKGSVHVSFSASTKVTTSVKDYVDALRTLCDQPGRDCHRFNWTTTNAQEDTSSLHVYLTVPSSTSTADNHGHIIHSPGAPLDGSLVLPISHYSASSYQDTAERIYHALSDLVPAVPPERPSRAFTSVNGKFTLAFSLLNEGRGDGRDGTTVMDWEIEQALQTYLEPVLRPLESVYEFTIESQILYQAPLKTSPIQTPDHSSWLITQDHMKTFVNSEQWTLDSSTSFDPVIRFLLFVPCTAHSPMRLETMDGSPAFHIPQMGGVVIHNVDKTASVRTNLNVDDLRRPFEYFGLQLHSLLGIPPTPAAYLESHDQAAGVTVHHRPTLDPWQKINLLRSLTRQNIEETRGTLNSISRLVASIKEMVINKQVRGDVEGAVEALRRIYEFPVTTLTSYQHSLTASALSTLAFFNPSMMGLLYFPDEHKYAVYTPLFAPVAVPVLIAGVKELKVWLKRRRAVKQAKSSKAES